MSRRPVWETYPTNAHGGAVLLVEVRRVTGGERYVTVWAVGRDGRPAWLDRDPTPAEAEVPASVKRPPGPRHPAALAARREADGWVVPAKGGGYRFDA